MTPSAHDLTDVAGAQLPRVYQVVPLPMTLRWAPVRVLIADDLGVGKTIKALLVTRGLLDRSGFKRFCVLCQQIQHQLV